MRLVLVELNRWRSRRAIALIALATVLAAVAFIGATAWNTRPLTQADRTDAAAQADLEGQRDELQQEVKACRADPAGYLGPSATADECAETLVPTAESYYPRAELDLRKVLDEEGIGLALLVIGLIVIAASTFAGADWSSRSMANQLVFVPRRTRVWLVKAAAVMIGSGLIALVVISGFWLGLGVVAESRGISTSSADLTHVLWHVVRSVGLAVAAGLGAFALTMVFRHTVATLALLFVYAVGAEMLVNLLPLDGVGRWSVGNNTVGWLAVHHDYYDPSITCAGDRGCSTTQVMSHLEAGTFLGVLLAISVVVSLLWFNRRDV